MAGDQRAEAGGNDQRHQQMTREQPGHGGQYDAMFQAGGNRVDRKVLAELQKDGRLSVTELADRVA